MPSTSPHLTRHSIVLSPFLFILFPCLFSPRLGLRLVISVLDMRNNFYSSVRCFNRMFLKNVADSVVSKLFPGSVFCLSVDFGICCGFFFSLHVIGSRNKLPPAILDYKRSLRPPPFVIPPLRGPEPGLGLSSIFGVQSQFSLFWVVASFF